ncbi:MAG: carboxymuconolactone decarboxylase family protein [Pseudomonadota bacterium]|nr:carboxymuconolactone decarboxylase family protein [Pseudomonadota bacterium]
MTSPYPPLSDEDWPQELADMLAGFAGGLNVYRTMAHHPALLRAWADLREHVVNQTTLGLEFSEVVILRTGWQLGSSYEWHQHIVRGRKNGLSDVRIARLSGPIVDIKGDDAVLATAVDDLFNERQLSQDSQTALVKLVGKPGMFDLIATVGFYSTLGYILNSFDTPLDQDIAGELATNPLKS